MATTNNVEIDNRGYIYIVDGNGAGMDILELTGCAKQMARRTERAFTSAPRASGTKGRSSTWPAFFLLSAEAVATRFRLSYSDCGE